MKSIWERLQHLRIEAATASADITQAKTYDLERRVKALEEEIDSVTLILMAMWELLGKSNGFYMKDLEARIEEIDLRDGKLDGKLDPNPARCPECSHALHDRRKVCIYCGTPIKPNRNLTR